MLHDSSSMVWNDKEVNVVWSSVNISQNCVFSWLINIEIDRCEWIAFEPIFVKNWSCLRFNKLSFNAKFLYMDDFNVISWRITNFYCFMKRFQRIFWSIKTDHPVVSSVLFSWSSVIAFDDKDWTDRIFRQSTDVWPTDCDLSVNLLSAMYSHN